MTDPDSSKHPIESVDLVLRVSTRRKDGDQRFEYRLLSPSGAVPKLSAQAHYSEPLGAPEAFRRDLLDQLEKLREGYDVEGKKTGFIDEEVETMLANIGRWLYRRLFPPSMHKAYRGFRDKVQTLLVVSDEAWIPWELIRPNEDRDDDFFCIQFEMGRWLAKAGDPVVVKGARRLLCLTMDASDGEVTRPEKKADEPEMVKALAESSPGATYLVLRNPTTDALKAQLSSGFDLLHFAGHGLHRDASVEDGADALRPELAQINLADRPFRALELEGEAARLRGGRPVVFFNSCQSGRLGQALTGLGGWAESWTVACGASAFLAPFLMVNGSSARKFAAIFYRELQEGQPLGSSLRIARREVRSDQPGDDVARLAYSLHGHPNLRIALGRQALTTIPGGFENSPLRLPERCWRPDRSPPGALLQAEFRVVPFHFRQSEIENLETWCRSGENLGIRLYTGPGGMGKTRLALEICRRLRSEGWQAGLVDHERPAEETWRDLEEIGGPRLLIVDYAETRRDHLVPLLRQIDRTEDDAPIRVLLLARAALDWWDQLKAEGDGVGELLSGPATRWHTLQPLAFSPEDRAKSYEIAAEAFAGRLEKDVTEDLPGDLDAEHYKRALLLHMSALAAVDGVDVKGEDGILDYVLDRERRFWGRLAGEWELPKVVTTGIGRAMAAITLGGGVDDEEKAVLAMRGLSFFRDEKENILISVARLLSETYPGENHWIEPVMPDLLGEHLIMREMEKDADELLDIVLGPGQGSRE
jgi:CHAT domain